MSAIAEIQAGVARTAETLGTSVVGIGDRWARGSGIVVGSGRVVTNAHNVRGDEVTVSFGDGRVATGTVAGADVDGDIAVIAVDTGDVRLIEWADGDVPPIGTPVFALANPGGHGLRVTFGLVSGTERSFRGPRGRRIAGSIEHTAPLLPGSSGGPVVDLDGRLLGINTNRLGEGFYLAIPAEASLRRRIDALGAGEAPARPRLGIGIAPPDVARGLRRAVGLPERDGLLVRVVEDGSPAQRAGIREGDLIVGAGGRALATPDDLYDVLDAASGGESLVIDVVRGTEERSTTVTF